ncbi:tyrosine-type recombinase/integrase [Lysobacter korlensis]|uniref:Tyrosine-type recombinase/integrase n=1 Tax=Lysobacter korlensis TaxID=553636 RepID=A0ABV6RVA8_9GAMM
MTTVEEVLDRYWPVIRGRVSGGTARGYFSAYRRRIAPLLGGRDVEDLTTLDVELAFSMWSGSRSTKIDALSMLSHICDVAVQARLIPTNPCRGVKLPKDQAADPSGRALNLEEVQRLIGFLPEDGPYRRFVLAMLLTGCRLGEVAGMRVSDVDLESLTIRVARTASAGFSGQLVVGHTKGRRVRVVPIADPLLPLVLEATRGRSPHDLLFPGPRGGHINSQNLSRALRWHKLRDRIKSFPTGEPPLHWHDLRHTAAVNFFIAGLSAPDVQAVLGHSSLAVTQLYADTRRDAARRAGTALSTFYAPVGLSKGTGGEAGESGL